MYDLDLEIYVRYAFPVFTLEHDVILLSSENTVSSENVYAFTLKRNVFFLQWKYA